MTESERPADTLCHTCEKCGQPAIVHIRPDAGEKAIIRHLCLACADAESAPPERRRRGLDHAAILIVVGAMVLVISVGADFFAFGEGESFGWRQQLGVGLGLLLLMTGALVEAPAVIIIGLLTMAVTLLADYLELGSIPGFGRKQIVGTALGLIMVLAGLRAGTRRRGAKSSPAGSSRSPGASATSGDSGTRKNVQPPRPESSV